MLINNNTLHGSFIKCELDFKLNLYEQIRLFKLSFYFFLINPSSKNKFIKNNKQRPSNVKIVGIENKVCPKT